jgi:hypothetical protein
MKRRLILQCVYVAIFCVFAAMSAQAQVPTATINGRVTDPGGAVVSGAIVTATNQTTTVDRTTVTNSDGLYLLPDQPVGLYTVTIKAIGFADSQFKELLLQVGRVTTVDAELKVAPVGTSIIVGSTNNSVDLTQSVIQGQITSTTIQSIPLNGRNFLELAYLVPGNRPWGAAATLPWTAETTTTMSLAVHFRISRRIRSLNFRSRRRNSRRKRAARERASSTF